MATLSLLCAFIFAGAVSANFPVPPPLCKKPCLDISRQCASLTALCAVPGIKLVCADTCGECKKCVGSGTNFPGRNCEAKTCADAIPPILCKLYKKHRLGCMIAGRQCRATCGRCQPCELPPSPKPCSNGCIDGQPSCSFWKKEGFCNPDNGFPDVLKVCPLSCKKCKPCSNPLLPPIVEQLKRV